MFSESRFASFGKNFVRGCILGHIEARHKVQTLAHEMREVTEGELEAHEAMFTRSPLILLREKDTLIGGTKHLP